MAEEETQCDICNLTLRTKAIAAAHYEGKKHKLNIEKKAKKESQVEIQCDVCELTLRSEKQADAHFEGKKHKALVVKKESGEEPKKSVLCEVCNISMPSEVIAKAHYEGKRHKQNVTRKESGDQENFETNCDVCNLKLSTPLIATAHFNGKKHKANVAKKEVGEKVGGIFCEVCDITLSNPVQASAHFEGKRHKTSLSKKEGTNISLSKKESTNISLSKQGGENKTYVVCKNISDLESQLAEATAIDADGDLPMDEDAWIKARNLMCGLCLVKLESKLAAVEHFGQPNHLKREQLQAEGDLTKWCPVCLVPFNSPPSATMHYNGKQHRSKTEQAKKIGSINSDDLKLLDPTNAIRAAMLASRPIKQGMKRVRGSSASADKDEPVAKKSQPTSSKLKEGFFNCLFCNLPIKSNEMDNHRASKLHLDNVQKAAELQSTKQPSF